MSGHSKWSTIKRKKGALDAKRSKIFSKIIKEISIAVKQGGANPEGNPALRLAIANAKGANMPKDNMRRAIDKAGEKGGSLTEASYEGYANGGVAIFIECLSDNIQRTIANIRSYFNKYGGNLGTNGCLRFIFDRKGIFTVPQNEMNEEEFTLSLIDAGADDVVLEEGYFTITTTFENFGSMQKKLEEINIAVEKASVERIPNTFVKLDLEAAKKVMRLIEIFEDDDDVQNVYHNLEMTDELMNELS